MHTYTKRADERKLIKAKFGNRCTYCGCDLLKKWHVDHFLPLRRNQTWNDTEKRFRNDGTCMHPERDVFKNKVPACIPCNISKGSLSIEDFREKLAGHVKALKEYSSFKAAIQYNQIKETESPVIFYFETIKDDFH